jgi:hypothetical protein
MPRKETIYPMTMERDEEIRQLAYQIWQQEGCPAGCEVEHWLRAESIWREGQRPKRNAKGSKPLQKTSEKQTKTPKKTKSRKAATAEA